MEYNGKVPFQYLVQYELDRGRKNNPKPINSAHEGYAVLLEELDELKEQVFLHARNRNQYNMLKELVQISGLAQRMAEDLGYLEKTWDDGKINPNTGHIMDQFSPLFDT